MSDYILNYGLYVVFLVIIKEYFDIFFVAKKYNKFIIFIIWSCYFFLQLEVGNYINTPLLSLAYNALSLYILCSITYKGTIKSKILFVITFIVIWMIVELLTAYFLEILNMPERDINKLGIIFSKIVLMIIIKNVQSRLRNVTLKDINLQYWLYIFILPCCSGFIIHNLYINSYSRHIEGDLLTPISIILILLLNLSFYKIYDKLSDDTEIQKQNFIFEKQIQLCTEQIQEREDRDLEMRELKHNIQGHLLCFNEYIQQNDMIGLKEYFGNVYHDFENKEKKICESGNVVIDTIINYKYRECIKYGITFETDINIPINTIFNNADISIILENALQNAIEATLKLDMKKRDIKIKMTFHHQNLLIEVCNSYDGIVKRNREGRYLTLKKDTKNHGMGLRSIEKAASKYNGLITIEENDEIFVLNILLYGKVF